MRLRWLQDGNIILSDRQNHRISVFTKEGSLVKRFGDFGEGTDAQEVFSANLMVLLLT